MNLPHVSRLKAQRDFSNINITNGIAVNLTFGQIIFLLALFYGANDLQMGLLYVAIHITGLFAVGVPVLFNGWFPKNVWFFANTMRGLLGIGYLTLPLFPSEYRVGLLLLIYYGFMVFRSFNYTMLLPIINDIARKKEISGLTAVMMRNGNLSIMAGTIISFLFMNNQIMSSELANYQVLLCIGVLATFITSTRIYRLPTTTAITCNGMGDLYSITQRSFKDPVLRKVFILSGLQTILMVLSSYQINVYRNLAGLGPELIFLIALVSLFLSFTLNVILPWLTPYISMWSLMAGSHALIAISALALSLAGHWLREDCFIFFLSVSSMLAIGLSGSITLFFKLQSDALPKDKSFEVNIIFQLVAALGAILSMVLVALINPLSSYMGGWFHTYSPIFVLVVFISLIIMLLGSHLSGLHHAVRELSLISPLGLWTLYKATKINMVAVPHKVIHQMEEVLSADNRISKKLIGDYLRSPDYLKNLAAIRTYIAEPDKQWVPLLKQKLTQESPFISDILTALGFTRDPDVIHLLKPWTQHSNPSYRLNAYKGLMRCHWDIEEKEWLDIYREIEAPESRFNILHPAAENRKISLLLNIIDLEIQRRASDDFMNCLFINLASVFDERDFMVDLLDTEQDLPGGGIILLKDQLPLEDQSLVSYIQQGNYVDLATWIQQKNQRQWLAWNRSTALGLSYLSHLSRNSTEAPYANI